MIQAIVAMRRTGDLISKMCGRQRFPTEFVYTQSPCQWLLRSIPMCSKRNLLEELDCLYFSIFMMCFWILLGRKSSATSKVVGIKVNADETQ